MCPRLAITAGSAILWALCSFPAWAEPTIAVITHPVVNVPDEESGRLASEIAQVLQKRYNARFISGREVTNKLPTNLADDCAVQPSCTRDLGQKLGAEQLLFLVMVRVGTKVQIDSTWVDVGVDRSSTRDPIMLESDPTRRVEVIRETAPTLVPRGALITRAEKLSPDQETGKNDPADISARADRAPRERPEIVDAWAEDRVTQHKAKISAGVWVAGGVSAAALVTGIVMIITANKDYNAVVACEVNARPCEIDGSLNRFSTLSAVSSFLLSSAALAAATAVGLYAMDADDGGRP
ncbi:MAG: hypothetical protein U1E65_11495 [Myxococcota bacterium]